MPLTLVTTPGAVDANSYNSLVELSAFADVAFPTPVAWYSTGDEDRARAAVMATREIDRMRGVGCKSDVDQALEWPRDDEDLPDNLKLAHATLTVFLVSEVKAGRNPSAPAKDAGVSSISFGSELSMSFEAGATSMTPLARFISEVVRPILGSLVYANQTAVVRG